MSIEYSREIGEIDRTTRVDGDGEVNIEYSQYYPGGGSSTEELSVELSDLELTYISARAHRFAYQRYVERDYKDEDRYDLDYRQMVAVLRIRLSESEVEGGFL